MTVIDNHTVVNFKGTNYYISKKGVIKYSPTFNGGIVDKDLANEINEGRMSVEKNIQRHADGQLQ